MQLPSILIEEMVRSALKEDMGHGLDITSAATLPPYEQASGVIKAREEGVLAGLIPALTAFHHVDPDIEFEIFAQDGEVIDADQDIAMVSGPAAALLMAERVALNFMTHMSGIASLTRRYVLAVQGTKARICDTRKTLPGLRAMQKYAVRAGGGFNHRFGMDDAVLIKDNHIAIAGGIDAALSLACENTGHMVRVEIEVDTLDQLKEVLEHGGADVVMMDNFSLKDLERGVKMTRGKMVTEASGGVDLGTVRDIAETGIDYISVGALTHSAPALDIGLDVEI
ncbi:MAG: carboxylating nicotinate-nucleotide diphosphorylase [Alphaproteobacteria bacterium]|nr:carboxylating nicotinate-nucleotide diphosphorylase [Alphaproteobacteria bacterium]